MGGHKLCGGSRVLSWPLVSGSGSAQAPIVNTARGHTFDTYIYGPLWRHVLLMSICVAKCTFIVDIWIRVIQCHETG
jgi:hypothetical protein